MSYESTYLPPVLFTNVHAASVWFIGPIHFSFIPYVEKVGLFMSPGRFWGTFVFIFALYISLLASSVVSFHDCCLPQIATENRLPIHALHTLFPGV